MDSLYPSITSISFLPLSVMSASFMLLVESHFCVMLVVPLYQSPRTLAARATHISSSQVAIGELGSGSVSA